MVAGIGALCSLFPVIHLAVGLAMVTGHMDMHAKPGEPDPALFGWFFVAIAGAMIAFGLTASALIAFAGRSYVLSPLTVDAGALDLFLDNLDPSVVGQAGSSLARAIANGTALLMGTRSGADRALIVMSDGEAFEDMPDVITEARRAGQQGIHLVTVGFGSTEGSNNTLILSSW